MTERMPERGTRPHNRREIVIAAAAELFATRGYANVGIGEIAAAVNVSPSALYRHFSGKQEILREAIAWGTRARTAAVRLGEPDALDDVLSGMARSTLDTRWSTSLWTQEVRNLGEDERQEIRAEIRKLPTTFASKLVDQRPELSTTDAEVLAWSALDVLASISFHEERLPTAQFTRVLRDCMARIVAVAVPTERTVTRVIERPRRTARREILMDTAADLLTRHGYGAVTVEDLSHAAGMSTAGLYGYFPSKQGLLAALVTRSVEWQAHAAHQALVGVDTAHERLHCLIDAHLWFCFEQASLAALPLTELRNLPDGQASVVDLAMRDAVAEWVDLLCQIDPDRNPVVARIQVLAARMVVTDVVTTPSLRSAPDLLALVRAACCAALDL